MGDLNTMGALQRDMIEIVTTVINAVNLSVSAIEQMQSAMSEPIDTAPMQDICNQLNQAAVAAQQLETALQNVGDVNAEVQLQHTEHLQTYMMAGMNGVQSQIQMINRTFLQLSQTVRNVENYLRDCVNNQKQFNLLIQAGMGKASGLQTMISSIFDVFDKRSPYDKVKGWAENSAAAFETLFHKELQLVGLLNNTSVGETSPEMETSVQADTESFDTINALQNRERGICVLVRPEVEEGTMFEQIRERAFTIQSGGIIDDTTMLSGAVKLSAYFTDTDAVTSMMDTLSNYAVGMNILNGKGLTVDAKSMTQYADELGSIMTGTYSDMVQKCFIFTDAQKAIIDGTATEAQIVETLGRKYLNMSAQMQAAAAIDSAISASWGELYQTISESPAGKIAQLENACRNLQEVIAESLYPYAAMFADIILNNWGTIGAVFEGIITALQNVLVVMAVVMQTAIMLAQGIVDNWSWIGPIILGTASALAVYYGWQMLCAAATNIMSNASNIFNGIMSANPIILVIMAIIMLISVIYVIVGAINHFAGTAVSAAGVICGVFMTIAAVIANLIIKMVNSIIDVFVVLWNFFAAFANFIGNLFQDPIGTIARLFFGLGDKVLGVLEMLASGIDAVFGSNLATTIAGWRSTLSGLVEETFGQEEIFVAKIDADDYHLKEFDYGDAWNAGYSFGEGIDESIQNFDMASLFGVDTFPSAEDFADQLASKGMQKDTEGISEESGMNIANIAGDTGAMADSMEITGEELKYLRDIAEQEAVNRFTTAEINIEQTNNNNIASNMDLDGIVLGLSDAVGEAIDIMAEGVHG